MGAWAYCEDCQDVALPRPGLAEALIGYVECDCGYQRALDEWDKRYIAEQIEEQMKDQRTMKLVPIARDAGHRDPEALLDKVYEEALTETFEAAGFDLMLMSDKEATEFFGDSETLQGGWFWRDQNNPNTNAYAFGRFLTAEAAMEDALDLS